MLRKLIVLAITSGLAAKLYRNYVRKHANAAPAGSPATPRTRAGPPTNHDPV
jgi:hypothetical protein